MNMTITCYKELGEITIWDKKFNSVGNKYTNKVISTKHISAEKLKSLENTGDIKLLSTGLFDGYTDCADTSIINDLEVITIPSGGTANIKYYNGKFIDSGNLLAVSSNPKLYNLKYIYYYLHKHISLIDGAFRGASIKHPQMEDILSIKIPICDITTQNQIVSILSELDNKIEKQNQIIDKFKKIKQSFLELLFPQNTDIPQLRFNSFTDTWEQRKLGNCFDERIERSANGELIAVTINSGVVKASELNRHDTSSKDKSNYKVVKINDIAYNSMRMWQGASGFSKYNGILSPAYTVVIPKENIDSIFFAYLFKKTDIIEKFKLNSQGLTSDTWNLKFPKFSTIIIKVPKIEEQQKISSLFTNLDNLITLHQRKLDKLKEVKSALLDKLLV